MFAEMALSRGVLRRDCAVQLKRVARGGLIGNLGVLFEVVLLVTGLGSLGKIVQGGLVGE